MDRIRTTTLIPLFFITCLIVMVSSAMFLGWPLGLGANEPQVDRAVFEKNYPQALVRVGARGFGGSHWGPRSLFFEELDVPDDVVPPDLDLTRRRPRHRRNREAGFLQTRVERLPTVTESIVSKGPDVVLDVASTAEQHSPESERELLPDLPGSHPLDPNKEERTLGPGQMLDLVEDAKLENRDIEEVGEARDGESEISFPVLINPALETVDDVDQPSLTELPIATKLDDQVSSEYGEPLTVPFGRTTESSVSRLPEPSEPALEPDRFPWVPSVGSSSDWSKGSSDLERPADRVARPTGPWLSGVPTFSFEKSEVDRKELRVEVHTGELNDRALESVPAVELNQINPSDALQRYPQESRMTLQVQGRLADAYRMVENGAYEEARAELFQALWQIAHALDEKFNQTAHCRALEDGKRALKEVEDFIPNSTQSTDQLDLAAIVAGHRTPVLKEVPVDQMSISIALKAYYGYARLHLARAGEGQTIASEALYGLGKLHAITARQSKRRQSHESIAIVMHQAALTVDEKYYLAANELGVMLAYHGQHELARDAFLHCLKIRAMGATWHNLATVHLQLGELELAQLAENEFQLSSSTAPQTKDVKFPATVRWLDPREFLSERDAVVPRLPEPKNTSAPRKLSKQSSNRSPTLARQDSEWFKGVAWVKVSR